MRWFVLAAALVCASVAVSPAAAAKGTIVGEKFWIPIVGGTGSYTGATGYVEVTNGIGGQDSNKSNDKFVITG
jgi:hypothetical protein